MSNYNYIRHLNAFFSFVRSDNRLSCSHVSLYLALFQYWNFNRFNNPFPVYRENLMQISKIGSKNTYHKCIRLLHETEYIIYHPPLSKFQPVKISIRKLDAQHQERSFKQLDLFASSPSLLEKDLGRGRSTNSDTVYVPKMTDTSPKNDTDTVPKVGQYIKQNNKTENSVYNTPTKIFEKNKNIQDGINSFIQQDQAPLSSGRGVGGEVNSNRLRVSKSVHDAVTLRSPDTSGRHSKSEAPKPPQLSDVETFFRENNYPIDEARKFYYYNQGKNWMLTDKIPIYDWKALASKWMLNMKEEGSKEPVIDLDKELQYLYQRFLEGSQISKLILPEYCDHLNLTITAQVTTEAIQRRVNQLIGTNQHSESQLWQAYKGEIQNDAIIQKDKPNLLALSKRLAVFKHFEQLKQNGRTCIK